MTRIEIAGRDFRRILKACANACDKSNFRSVLRYIELRAEAIMERVRGLARMPLAGRTETQG